MRNECQNCALLIEMRKAIEVKEELLKIYREKSRKTVLNIVSLAEEIETINLN